MFPLLAGLCYWLLEVLVFCFYKQGLSIQITKEFKLFPASGDSQSWVYHPTNKKTHVPQIWQLHGRGGIGNGFWKVLVSDPQSPQSGDWGSLTGTLQKSFLIPSRPCKGTISSFTIIYNLYIKNIYCNVATNSMLLGGVCFCQAIVIDIVV